MGLFRRRNQPQLAHEIDQDEELPLRELVAQCIRRQDALDAEFASWTDKLTQWFARQRRRDQIAVAQAMEQSSAPQQLPPDIPPSAEFTREQKKAALRQRLRGA